MKGAPHSTPAPAIESGETTDERATLVPGFDVSRLARDSNRWNASPSGVRPAVRVPSAPDDGSVHVRAADVYWSRVGGSDAVPWLLVSLEQIAPEHRAHCEGFLLCRIDGVATLADIIEQSTLPELTALSLACDLLDAGIIAVSQRSRRVRAAGA